MPTMTGNISIEAAMAVQRRRLLVFDCTAKMPQINPAESRNNPSCQTALNATKCCKASAKISHPVHAQASPAYLRMREAFFSREVETAAAASNRTSNPLVIKEPRERNPAKKSAGTATARAETTIQVILLNVCMYPCCLVMNDGRSYAILDILHLAYL